MRYRDTFGLSGLNNHPLLVLEITRDNHYEVDECPDTQSTQRNQLEDTGTDLADIESVNA